MRNNLSFLKVYKKKNIKSEVVTQLLYGDNFKKLNKTKSWVKIKNDSDNYVGYIKFNKFPQNCLNTHKIFSLSANLYTKPNIKYKIKKN